MSEPLLRIARLAAVLLLPQVVAAQEVNLDRDMTVESQRGGWLPYAFATDSLGTAFGAAGGTSGKYQWQSSLFGAAMATTNDSWSLIGTGSDFRLPGTERLFSDIYLLVGHFTDERFYADLDRDPTQIKAGTNDSEPDDFVSGISNNVALDLTFKYPLPIGNARDEPVSVYRLDRGLLLSGPSGGTEWSPLTSGKTTLAGRFFFRYRDLDEETRDQIVSARSNGLEFWLDYNNVDFMSNPASGSRQKLTLTRDFGWFDSSGSWTNLELELSKYFNLGTSDWFRHQVLALNFWTSSTPTWETDPDDPQRVNHRPPPGQGSYLGGFDRLRAFPDGRFHDKSAVYYAGELRLIPRTNPLRDLPLLNYFEIDWWQLVAFAEAGRVGPEYDTELFTDDLKTDVGLGFRLMAFRVPVRLDWAVSDEDSSIWAMVSQPFARP